MYKNQEVILRLRANIPAFECVKGCHDCCGPVTTSSEEMLRLPVKTDAEHEAALNEFNCVHLGPNGCTVYDERPLIVAYLVLRQECLARMIVDQTSLLTLKLSVKYITL